MRRCATGTRNGTSIRPTATGRRNRHRNAAGRRSAMRVLLTGASSFTGYWFAGALAAAGHAVVAPLRGAVAGYEGVRGERVRRLAATAAIAENCPVGSAPFAALLRGGGFDLFAHHAAATADYRSA